MIPKSQFYKGFAKSKKDFIKNIQTIDKKHLEEDYPVDVSLLKPSMVEERKAYKGYRIRGEGYFHKEPISEEEAKQKKAEVVYGDWNEYVREFEGIHPKPGEHYYEYIFPLHKIEKK